MSLLQASLYRMTAERRQMEQMSIVAADSLASAERRVSELQVALAAANKHADVEEKRLTRRVEAAEQAAQEVRD